MCISLDFVGAYNRLQNILSGKNENVKQINSTDSEVIPNGISSPIMNKDILEAHFKRKLTGLESWMTDFMQKMPKLPQDICSNAEPDKAITTHLVWDVEAPDFAAKILQAKATYDFNNLIEGNDKLILDVKNLKIDINDSNAVTVNGQPALFDIQKSGKEKSDALIIKIPTKKGLGKVSIKYQTHPDAEGIFWIDKQYTEGQKHPLLYTLFEPVGSEVIPGQHTPQVRLTFEVNVKTNNPDYMALSSVSNNPTIRNPQGVYNGLRMTRAVPLYLLSLHVGNFAYKEYDKRTGVYAEDSMIQKSAEALQKLPQFMQAAEEVCGLYNWGKYTPIILCWAFPYKAMEHPCASTCGAVCLEQTEVIIHELSHSWSGNDTTNCNWQQFFWNEGFTTFIEYLITAKVFGEDYAGMKFLYTLAEAKQAIEKYRHINPEVLKLCNSDKEIVFTRIPYAKGALFFFMLREAIGHEDFGKFIKDYMKVFYQNTMSDNRFLAFLKIWLEKNKKITDFEEFKKIHKVDEWLYGTEIPSNAPEIQSKILKTIDEQINKIAQNQPIEKKTIQSWDISTQMMFLTRLKGKASNQQLAQLDSLLNFTNTTSMSILGEWAQLCALSGHFTASTTEMIISYVIKRNSLHEANKICSALCKTAQGRQIVERILAEEKGRLFTVTKETIKKTLDILPQ